MHTPVRKKETGKGQAVHQKEEADNIPKEEEEESEGKWRFARLPLPTGPLYGGREGRRGRGRGCKTFPQGRKGKGERKVIPGKCNFAAAEEEGDSPRNEEKSGSFPPEDCRFPNHFPSFLAREQGEGQFRARDPEREESFLFPSVP